MNLNARLVLLHFFAGMLLMLACTTCSRAQPSSAFHEKVTHAANDLAPATSRDFWFAPALNYAEWSGESYTLFVTSRKKTLAHIQLADSAIHSISVSADSMTAFRIPLSWEIKSSSIVENKGIHLWSDGPDLSAVVVSHAPYSSDAMHLIPTNECGTDYVVASAFNENEETNEFSDIPSEIVIIATHDSTIVNITPSADFCMEDSEGSCGVCTIHPAGIPFAESLSRGQTAQYKVTIVYQGNRDASGTIIRSNWPVGVVGAAQCSNVPGNYNYCDHLCEMIPPIVGWGSSYYTVPFDSAKGGSSFLVIGSIANQTIYRTDTTLGKTVFCQLGKVSDMAWNYAISLPSMWESDAPFLLVQYMNSASFPDDLNGIGDPCMMVIPSVDHFAASSSFIVPDTTGRPRPPQNGTNAYDWYINAMVNHRSSSMTYDGKSLRTFPKHAVDSLYDIYTIPHAKPGAHVILADSGVGVDVYGIGYYESMAYGTRAGLQPTMNVVFREEGSCLRALISDSLSRIASVVLDSASHLSFALDQNFKPGLSQATSVQLCSNNKDCTGSATFSVYDSVGKRTQVEIAFNANRLDVQTHDFAPVKIGSTTTKAAVTFTNPGPCPITLDSIFMLNTYTGWAPVFTLNAADSSANRPPITIPPYGSHTFNITFYEQFPGLDSARLVARETDGSFQDALIRGSSISDADFLITPFVFDSIKLGDSVSNPTSTGEKTIKIRNLSKTFGIAIDTIWTDSKEFKLLSPVQLFLKPGSDIVVSVLFKPSDCGARSTPWHAMSHTLAADGLPLGVRNSTLAGFAFCEGVTSLTSQKNPARILLRDDGRTARAILPPNWTNPVSLLIENVLGIRVLSATDASIAPVPLDFDISTLPNGAYFYRLTCGTESAVGKLVIQR